MKIEIIIEIFILLLLSACSIINYDDKEEQKFNKYIACRNSMQEIERQDYDLVEDYNITCKKIEFILSNINIENSINLKKYHIIYEPTLENCSLVRSELIQNYQKQDFVNYYMDKCRGE